MLVAHPWLPMIPTAILGSPSRSGSAHIAAPIRLNPAAAARWFRAALLRQATWVEWGALLDPRRPTARRLAVLNGILLHVALALGGTIDDA